MKKAFYCTEDMYLVFILLDKVYQDIYELQLFSVISLFTSMDWITMDKQTFISFMRESSVIITQCRMLANQKSNLLFITDTLKGFSHCLYDVHWDPIAGHQNKSAVINQNNMTEESQL